MLLRLHQHEGNVSDHDVIDNVPDQGRLGGSKWCSNSRERSYIMYLAGTNCYLRNFPI